MKTTAKFIASLALALLLAFVVRAYAFTVFSVPQGGLPPKLKAGNRVIVNRLDCDKFRRGETIIFSDSLKPASPKGQPQEVYFIGMIESLPGDTMKLDTASYIIPTVCCKRCQCKDCRYYLVRTSQGRQLVHKHQMIGKAYKLF